MRGTSRGQMGAELALVLAFLAALGLTGFQFLGLLTDAVKVSHAAQEAAYVAGSSPEAAGIGRVPCWAVTGGLVNPAGYADAQVCRTVVENLGNLAADQVVVSVTPSSLTERGRNVEIHVRVTYKQRIDSPLLRLFTGPTVTFSSDARDWSK